MRASVTIASGVVLAVGTVAVAGPEKIAYPENYQQGVLYATVDRPDIKQYRELWATPEAVKAMKEGRPIPSGTVLTLVQYRAQVDAQGNPIRGPNGRFVKGDLLAYTVMEKRAGWGTEYPPELRNGEWEYSAFTADKKFNQKANIKACFECHKPHEKQDFVISLAQLAGTFPTAAAAKRSGPTEISITGFVFGPAKLTVAPGQAVVWTNTDDSPHQIAFGGVTKTGVLLKGQSAAFAFDKEGMYDYICSLHPTMKGQVEVKK